MVIIERTDKTNRQTLGNLIVYGEDGEPVYKCKTLELPDNQNKSNISCIPEGRYTVVKHSSPRFGKSFWIKDVPGRSQILIHVGNYYWDIRGCILVGKSHVDISGDGIADLKDSKVAINELWQLLPDRFELSIISWQ